MTFPTQTLTVQDPGTQVTPPVSTIPLISGPSTGGSVAVNTVVQVSQPSQIRSLFGYGQLAEDLALALSKRGGPIYACRHNATGTALSAAAMTQAGSVSPPAMTLTGTPTDRYKVVVTVVLGGTRGTATFKYTLDAWDEDVATPTQSQVRLTAATYVMANSGLTINMATGTYVAGDTYTLAVVPPEVGTTDLAAVAAVLEADPTLDFYLWLVSGSQPDEVTAEGVAVALSGHIATLANTYRYVRGFVDIGSEDTSANVHIENAAWTSTKVCPAYGYVLRSSLLPFEGFSTRKISCSSGIAIRAMGSLISTDLARFSDGPDEGVLAIYFDSLYDQTLDTDGNATMRTWPGSAGFYIAGGKLKAPFGSNFTDVQFGRIMDVACKTTYLKQLQFEADSFRTVAGTGAIDPRDASTIEQIVGDALADNLTRPNNARGVPGHVSSFTYTVDQTVNLVSTGQLKTTVAMVPLGYPKDIQTTLLFTL